MPLNSYTLVSLCLLFDKSLYLLIIILTNYKSNPGQDCLQMTPIWIWILCIPFLAAYLEECKENLYHLLYCVIIIFRYIFETLQSINFVEQMVYQFAAHIIIFKITTVQVGDLWHKFKIISNFSLLIKYAKEKLVGSNKGV